MKPLSLIIEPFVCTGSPRAIKRCHRARYVFVAGITWSASDVSLASYGMSLDTVQQCIEISIVESLGLLRVTT